MNKKLKIIIPILIILLIAVIVIKKFKQRKEAVSKIPTAEIPVYTVKGVKVKKGWIIKTQRYLGFIEPDKSINVASKFSGFIEKVYVSENQSVKKGDLLVKIDDKDIKLQINNLTNLKASLLSQKKALEAQLIGAKARLDYLKHKFERDKKLYIGKAISKESFELSKANYLNGKATVLAIKSNIKAIDDKIKSTISQINIQKNNLKYSEIYSDVDGIVTKVLLHEGNLATPGKPILNVQTTKNYKILVNIAQKDTINIHKGQEVYIDFPSKKLIAKINKLYPKSSNNSLVVAEIRINNLPDGVPTYSYVNLDVNLGKVTGYKVPINSILNMTRSSFVLTIKDGKFLKIPVKILAQNEKYAIVTGNLTKGMPVAVAMENKLMMLAMGKKGRILISQ